MKTEYTNEDVSSFLQSQEQVLLDSIEQLTEGHISQALGFETIDGRKYVLRLASRQNDFLADKFAYLNFGKRLRVPKVVEVGSFGKGDFYCISERVPGISSNDLTQKEIDSMLPEIYHVFSLIYKTDISSSTGYGAINTETGNAPNASMNAGLTRAIEKISLASYKTSADYIGLDTKLIDGFIDQFYRYLPYASEERRLFHGDLGFDNLLIDNGKVSGVIDWAQIGYGDWMQDFARLNFWWEGRFGDAKSFALSNDLESEYINERTALYFAVNALLTIDFCFRHKDQNTAQWLRENVASKIINP